MKKKFIVLLTALLIGVNTMVISATETETTFGIVLDDEGNGMALNRETMVPIDPFYNYISYKRCGYKKGTFVLTTATLDEDGEWESRVDYIAPERKATQSELALYVEIYEKRNELSDLIWEVRK